MQLEWCSNLRALGGGAANRRGDGCDITLAETGQRHGLRWPIAASTEHKLPSARAPAYNPAMGGRGGSPALSPVEVCRSRPFRARLRIPMARTPPDVHQVALPLRILWRIYAFLASLRLAVLLIVGLVVVLAWATVIEQRYGGKAAWFGIYGAWWFSGLLILLGINVLAAALIRFPWKRHQTGFVITHLGILVLLAGCLLSRMGGIDAQMPIYEGTRAHRAFEDVQRLELAVIRAGSGAASSTQTVSIPFQPGPFNWADYARLSWFPWALAARDQGVLFDRDGIRIEVLDYCSDAAFEAFDENQPPLRIRVKVPRAGQEGAGGRDQTAETPVWQEVGLVAAAHGQMDGRNRASLPGGRQIVFWLARTQAETQAFLDSRPQGPLGEQGRLVLHAAGQRFEFDVANLASGQRVPLGDTGLEVERAALSRRFLAADLPILDLRVRAAGGPPQRMLIMADAPELNQQDPEHGVYATYWRGMRQGEAPAVHSVGGPRVDILQGTDRRLYYRTWNAGRIEGPGPLADDGSVLVAFAGSPQELPLAVERFVPQDRPGQRMVPLAYVAKKSAGEKTRLVRLRMTVDDQTEDFWLEGLLSFQAAADAVPERKMVVAGRGRWASVVLRWKSVDLGFSVYLREFHRGLDPGTSMAAKYASTVDFLRRDLQADPSEDEDLRRQPPPQPDEILEGPVEISVNRPKDFVDPSTGRSYRFFQESFNGPWKPGDSVFDALVGANPDRDRLFVSILTVNYDPGRGLKYLGSLLVVAGVAVMFFMRAYFFKPRGREAAVQETLPVQTLESVAV